MLANGSIRLQVSGRVPAGMHVAPWGPRTTVSLVVAPDHVITAEARFVAVGQTAPSPWFALMPVLLALSASWYWLGSGPTDCGIGTCIFNSAMQRLQAPWLWFGLAFVRFGVLHPARREVASRAALAGAQIAVNGLCDAIVALHCQYHTGVAWLSRVTSTASASELSGPGDTITEPEVRHDAVESSIRLPPPSAATQSLDSPDYPQCQQAYSDDYDFDGSDSDEACYCHPSCPHCNCGSSANDEPPCACDEGCGALPDDVSCAVGGGTCGTTVL